MILPGKPLKLEGIIGMTWDTVFIFYPPKYKHVVWEKEPEWNSEKTYHINAGVLGKDENAYRAKTENINKDPTENSTQWEKLTPIDNTSFKAEFKCNPNTLKQGEGIVLSGETGKVSVKMKPAQTEKYTEGVEHFSLAMTDTEENLYEYQDGTIKWKVR